MLEALKQEVCAANLLLPQLKLVTFTWGNVSGIDRASGIVAIKPSGVPYEELTPEKIVLVDLDGNPVEGDLNPSSDLKTHLVLYKAFPELGGVVHTHSPFAPVYRSHRPFTTRQTAYFAIFSPCKPPGRLLY